MKDKGYIILQSKLKKWGNHKFCSFNEKIENFRCFDGYIETMTPIYYEAFVAQNGNIFHLSG